ncbi:low molecular weight protein arginine phosphatase [Risungbinella massiliensis]|uniref:low molecular weight protein arginine phosphatase n=1 Tax=Risungbinella massiliensis TaxID=1329796 RepID=UPI0005CC4FAE|nr:low molecular weight protein arginine phosphatase [Risungbinella massiliensis]
MLRVLFVCTGNTCRSPMAAEMMRQLAKEYQVEVEVKSAGIAAFPGSPASDHTQTILRDKGWSDHHVAQSMDQKLVDWADIVLTMTSYHRDVIREHYEASLPKTYTLAEYAHSLSPSEQAMKSIDIQDPFGGDLSIYRQCGEEIEEAIRIILRYWTTKGTTS